MPTACLEPYLFFNGRCDEALAFYAAAFRTTVDMRMTYADAPPSADGPELPPGWKDKVMHAQLRVGTTMLMLSDGCDAGVRFAGFSLSYSAPDEAEARRAFAVLADGATVTMPLGATFWSPCFGMLTDRFGVGWMVTVAS